MFRRKLKAGDTIICKGIKAEIGEILFQDAYIEDWVSDNRKYIDIEFKDVNGRYRHWKSHLDGGTIQYKEDSMDKASPKYYLKCYRTHEDEQYGHSDFITPSKFASIAIAEKRLRDLYDSRRYYQAMVFDGVKNRTELVMRGNNVYYFLYKSVLTELIRQLTERLLDNVRKVQKLKKGSYRCTLVDNNGSIDLEIEGTSSYLTVKDMVSGKWKGLFDDNLDDLIKAMDRLVGKPIKKFEWSTWYDFSRCYYVASSEERGSVDLYFDFF